MKLMRIASGIVVLAVLVATGRPVGGQDTPELTARTITSGGLERRYLIYVPETPNDESLPMLIQMHGLGGSAEGDEVLFRIASYAQQEGFILVYADGVGASWNAVGCCGEAQATDIDDVQFISDLIDDVAASDPVDLRRVYASGLSNGGMMAYRLACELSDRIAAVGQVAGTMYPDQACTPDRPVPVLAIHGTADVLVPYEPGPDLFGTPSLGATGTIADWAIRNECADAKYTTFSGTDVTCVRYCGCNAPVELCTVEGGGHNWPGAAVNLFELDPELYFWWGYQTNEIVAHEKIWEFVREHQLDADFVRGDVNANGRVGLSDAHDLLHFLLWPRGGIVCMDTADVNDDGQVELHDAIAIVRALFSHKSSIPSPFPECGSDPTQDALRCGSYPPCE